MESPHNLGGNYWGTLINADKSAAPLLEQLCLGLVQLMLSFESSSHGSSELTPDKLARFYRELGGNCDALFLETKGPALSFIYQALGCFHTLQPTKNPFEAPCIPALLPMGFVRWQVIQLLLSPDEHSQYLQSAVSRWDVPNPTGGTFPKVIPREAFPESPDQAMLQWHEKVSRRLEKDHVHRNTPRPSPGEFGRYNSNNNNNNIPTNGSRGEDYFSQENAYRYHDPRGHSDMDDEAHRHRRRRSPDTVRRSRLHRFEGAFDQHGTPRPASRNSSPRNKASPASVRIPTRSKSTRTRTKQAPLPRKYRSEPSSDSSIDETLFSSRRQRSSVDDDQPPGRSYRLSPSLDAENARRHSHDATHYKRDREPWRASPRHPHPHPPSKMKFYENMFDEQPTPRTTRDPDAPLPYEITTNVPRVHIRPNGTPVEVRAKSFSNGTHSYSGSSGSDRPRSSSGSAANWARRNSPSRRKVPVYE